MSALLMALLAACTLLREGPTAPKGPGGMDLSTVAEQVVPSPLDPHWHHGAFMEIFVRAYQDSDGDGVGDLKGLISRLDELQDLGIRGIWLMPITRSSDRDHGYATTDYRAVEPDYGTLQDMQTLLKEAHRRGIGVIMDYVINHGSHASPLFQEALKGPGNPYRSWFVWSDVAPQGWDIWGKNPWYHASSQPWAFEGEPKDLPAPPQGARGHYFGTFGPTMPDFNLRHGPTLEYHLSSLRFWLNLGLDGFRLDAVPHMIENGAQAWNDQPESRELTSRLQALIKRYPHRYTVCEATQSPTVYGRPEVCGAAFAFGYVQHFIGAARGETESVRELARYFTTAPAGMATFVSNHDIFAGPRLWDAVSGDSARYKLAAAGYLLQPGTPFIYYGEEVGQAGLPAAPGMQGDRPIRGPMSWSSDSRTGGFTRGQPFRSLAPNHLSHNTQIQKGDPQSIHRFYRDMIHLRNSRVSIARGSFEQARHEGLVLSYQRKLVTERTWVVINYGKESTHVESPAAAPQARLLYASNAGMKGAAETRRGLGAIVTLEPQSIQVWSLDGS